MFGTATYDTMPESFLTDPAAWDIFVGQVWQAVLAPLALPNTASVIEIAPGSSAKIGHALAAVGFSGQLHIVEAAPAALHSVAAHYKRLLPDAALYLYPATLADCRQDLPVKPDAILGNHIIDDMLLEAGSTDSATFNWATQYSNHIAPETQRAFAALANHPDAIASVSDELTDMITRLAPRHCVISQYPSSTLQSGGLSALNDMAGVVLATVRQQLATHYHLIDCTRALDTLPHYHNTHIGNHVLNPAYWLAGSCKI